MMVNMTNEQESAEYTRYDNAPIVEAVLEATVERTTPIELVELDSVIDENEEYPERINLMVASGQMTVGPRVSASASSHQVGYQFVSADRKMVIHCKQDGLAFSRLHPYTEWKHIFGEFRKFWRLYVTTIHPDNIKQVAVRYINRFDLPGPRIELMEYFRTYPHVSPDIRSDVAGFMNQIQLPQTDIGAHAVITQAGLPPAQPGVISVLLDIAISLPLGITATPEAIEAPLETLRKRKNELFEACIQPAARHLIEKDQP